MQTNISADAVTPIFQAPQAWVNRADLASSLVRYRPGELPALSEIRPRDEQARGQHRQRRKHEPSCRDETGHDQPPPVRMDAKVGPHRRRRRAREELPDGVARKPIIRLVHDVLGRRRRRKERSPPSRIPPRDPRRTTPHFESTRVPSLTRNQPRGSERAPRSPAVPAGPPHGESASGGIRARVPPGHPRCSGSSGPPGSRTRPPGATEANPSAVCRDPIHAGIAVTSARFAIRGAEQVLRDRNTGVRDRRPWKGNGADPT